MESSTVSTVDNQYIQINGNDAANDDDDDNNGDLDLGADEDEDSALVWAHQNQKKMAIAMMMTKKKKECRKYVFACAIFASLNSVLLGYDVGVMSGAILFIKEDLEATEVQLEVLVGCLSIMSLLGSLAGGKISNIIGRKWTMVVAAMFFQFGSLVMALAPSFYVLITGRLMAGIGIGFGVMIVPVYIAEISPSNSRGSLTSFPEIFVNIGILLGYISNYVFSGLSLHIGWRVMLGASILPSIFFSLALFIIPESPRWLVLRNRTDEAKVVLSKLADTDAEVEQRVVEIEKAASFDGGDNPKSNCCEFLNPSPALRRMLVTGIGIHFFQQITGIDATVYYSPTIFQDAGITHNKYLLAATIAVGFTKTIFILVSIFLVDRVGRKPLLYVSAIGMTFCLFSLSITLSLSRYYFKIAIASVCANMAFFSIGIGPVCWVLSSEIFPLRVRAQGMAVGVVVSRLCSGVVAMSFLSMSRIITVGGCFFVFGVASVLSIGFIYWFVPETKGKSLEEIDVMYRNGREGAVDTGVTGDIELEDVDPLIVHRETEKV
ncbi:putative Sugar transporter [Zostera marina]|uniref:Putative Sugar transporter n=1 Tax=Zostera marina TaxID=29655 RepID=A0A0K9P7L9_ZOSMR|nr:putative Sugar transporter [Zostera marina]